MNAINAKSQWTQQFAPHRPGDAEELTGNSAGFPCICFLLAVASIMLGFAQPARALDFWHASTAWAGQGACSATFTFDSGLDEIENLVVKVHLVDRNGNVVLKDSLDIDHFGDSSASRYAETFIESEAVCARDLVVLVDSATAKLNGKPTDLLRSGKIAARDFKPFRIRIERHAPRPVASVPRSSKRCDRTKHDYHVRFKLRSRQTGTTGDTHVVDIRAESETEVTESLRRQYPSYEIVIESLRRKE